MKKKKIVLVVGLALGMVGITGKTQAEDCAVYKLYNRNNQEFLYTTNPAEYHTLSALKQAWVPEGRGFKVSTTQEEGYRPVFRYFHPLKGRHVLTQNEAEGKILEAQGWRNEGIAFFAPAQGKEAVYRVRNEAGSYRYPADKATKDALLAQGWHLDGVAWTQALQRETPHHFEHSGSPALPQVPEGFASIVPLPNSSHYGTDNYPWGQCTWYVYNRAQELGIHYSLTMGNGGDWQKAPGYTVTQTPQEGCAVSFSPGQAGADATYGHVAFVEQVRSDGSILISESNVKGLGVVSYRTFSAQEAHQFHYVIGRS